MRPKKKRLSGLAKATNPSNDDKVPVDTKPTCDKCEQSDSVDKRKENMATMDKMESCKQEADYMNILSLEVLCNILNYLYLQDFLKLDHMSSKLHNAVTIHLRTMRTLNFTEGEILCFMKDKVSDSSLMSLLRRCNDLQYIYGFHPPFLSKRRQRGKQKLSIPGIIEALSVLKDLRGVEVSDTLVLEALLSFFPHVEILGTFHNRDGCFPIDDLNILRIPDNPLITSMHLTGIVVPKLPPMIHLKNLQLRYVHFINPHPFKDFAVPSLKTFVMANCAGPSNVLMYVPMIAGLAAARSLQRLELIRVPFLGGLLHHVIGESLRIHRFKHMQTLKFGACKHAIVMDLGFLAIASSESLEEMYLQPSLSKDSLFLALKMASARFPAFHRLSLGYTEPFQESGNWTNDDLVFEGLADIVEAPATICDVGMKAAGECFTTLKYLEIYNCPHLHKPTDWLSPGVNAYDFLRELVLKRCHWINLEDFCNFLPLLMMLESIHLECMFREPPKGCSRVGLSAGTGFGLASSLLPDGPINHNLPPNADVANNNGGNNNNNPANQNQANNQVEIIQINQPANQDAIQPPQVEIIQINQPANQNEVQPPQVEIIQINQPANQNEVQPPQVEIIHVSQPANQSEDNNSIEDTNEDDQNSVKENESKASTSSESEKINVENIQCDNNKTDENNVSKKTSSLTPVEKEIINECRNIDLESSFSPSDQVLNLHSKPSQSYQSLGRQDNQSESVKDATTEKNSSNEAVCGSSSSGIETCNEKGHASEKNESISSSSKCGDTNDFSSNSSNQRTELTDKCMCSDNENLRKSLRSSRSLNKNIDKAGKSEFCDKCHKVKRSNFRTEKGETSNSAQAEKEESKIKNCVSTGNSKTCISGTADNTCSSSCSNTNVMTTRSGKSLYGKKKGLVKKNSHHKQDSEDKKLTEQEINQTSETKNANTSVEGFTQTDVKEESNINSEIGEIEVNILSQKPSNKGKDYENNKKQTILKIRPYAFESKEKCKEVKVESGAKRSGNHCVTLVKRDEETGTEEVLWRQEIEDTTYKSLKMENLSGQSESESSSCRRLTRSQAKEEFKKQNQGTKKSVTRKRKSESVEDLQDKMVKNSTMDSSVCIVVMVDRWCQVNVNDVRNANLRLSSPNSGTSCGTSGYIKVIQRLKKSPKTCSKTTSTSDPVMEEDFQQVLRLHSDTLQCVTLNMVGITDLVVDDCPKLNKISGHACRVLKNVSVGNATLLHKVDFTHCKKLNENSLIDDIGALESKKSRVLYLRPMQEFSAEELERRLFSSKEIDYGICIIYDHNPEPYDTMFNKVRVMSWMDLLSGMNLELLKDYGYEEHTWNKKTDKKPSSYPWGRSIYKISGSNVNSSEWEIVTDIPWLRPLSESPDINRAGLRTNPDDKKAGLYCPAAKGHDSVEDCMKACLPHLKEGSSVFVHSLFVYVHLCDVNGTPTFDHYM